MAQLHTRTIALLASTATWALLSTPAAAQTTPVEQADKQASDGSDILVTARRRTETSIAVPVTISAVSGVEMEKRGIAGVDSLARTVPSIMSTETNGSPQGGIVAIRGLSGVESNPFSDQAVSFNIDGVPVARSSVRRLSQMDVQQVEIMKGPQALFFGKNSPAGIISVRSADPGSKFEAKVSAGYEFDADEIRTEGFVSTPISDTLGVRVAGYFSDMKGWLHNIAPSTGTGVQVPFSRRAPEGTEYAIRGTLKWAPSDRFDLRFKLSHNDYDGGGATNSQQQINCPTGSPQVSSAPENCVADDNVTFSDNIGPNFGIAEPLLGSGKTYLKSAQTLGSLEMNYDFTDWLKLSAITGYYRGENQYVGSFASNFQETGALPKQILASHAHLKIREITQELRLTSSLDGPVNFMFGGLYQDSHASNRGIVYRNANAPIFSANALYGQDGTAYSVFGQTQVKILPRVELSVGARYSAEEKSLTDFRAAKGAAPHTLVDVNAPSKHVSFKNLSPEASITYRPTERLTFYGAWKEGFLSGGFNVTQPTLTAANAANGNYVSAVDLRYAPQKTKGWEAGIKALLLDGQLRTNLSYYDYRTSGLQVTALVDLVQTLANAGKVRTRGIDFDFAYKTPVDGLTLTGALAWADGKYVDYQSVCYRGLPAPQCTTQVNRFTGKPGLYNDLSGTPLLRSPDWNGNIGADYVSPAFSGVKIGLSANMSFSSKFLTHSISGPGGTQRDYRLLDATVRVLQEDDRWELALIGRNLGNTHFFLRSADQPFTGSAPGGAAATSVLGDTYAVLSRSREIMLRATVRFGG